jgi:hypothetical protein
MSPAIRGITLFLLALPVVFLAFAAAGTRRCTATFSAIYAWVWLRCPAASSSHGALEISGRWAPPDRAQALCRAPRRSHDCGARSGHAVGAGGLWVFVALDAAARHRSNVYLANRPFGVDRAR